MNLFMQCVTLISASGVIAFAWWVVTTPIQMLRAKMRLTRALNAETKRIKR